MRRELIKIWNLKFLTRHRSIQSSSNLFHECNLYDVIGRKIEKDKMLRILNVSLGVSILDALI